MPDCIRRTALVSVLLAALVGHARAEVVAGFEYVTSRTSGDLIAIISQSPREGALAASGSGFLLSHQPGSTSTTPLDGSGTSSFAAQLATLGSYVAPSRGQLTDDVLSLAPRFGVADPVQELTPLSAYKDSLGMAHFLYQQTYRGIPVMGAELGAHYRADGSLSSVNGRMSGGLAINTTPTLSAAAVIDVARQMVLERATELPRALDDGDAAPSEVDHHGHTHGSLSSAAGNVHLEDLRAYAEPKLKIRREPTNGGRDQESRLVWEVQVVDADMRMSPTLFIDAHDGSLRYLDTGVRELNRKSYDCGDEFGDVGCWSNKASELYPGYTYGRIEGMPVRGPSPHHATFGQTVDVFGSTGVDDNYDYAGLSHDYYVSKFGRNGGNVLVHRELEFRVWN